MSDSGSKIYRVVLRNIPVRITELLGLKEAFYFGSMAAIFEVFTPEEIGCTVRRLWALKIRPGAPYVGQKATVSQEVLIRKTTNRRRSK